MSTAPVTVIIPTLDGGALFQRVLAALGSQEPRPESVMVIDSASTDGSDAAAESAGAEVVRIRREEFDHGATRQLGAERARTELVAFLSQDALPAPGFVGALVDAFEDGEVAGASARILPHDDSRPLTRRSVLASPMASNAPRSAGPDDGAERSWDAPPMVDNVASMVRRDVLLRLPFPRTMMGEDAAFADQALRAGHRLVFVPRAVVYHAHEYGPRSAFRRYCADARWLRRQYGVRVRRSVWSVLRGVAYEVREDVRYLRSEASVAPLSEWLRSPALRVGQVLGQWWGSRGGVA